ncbi:MAG: YjgN family protein [Rhodospirillaceae bacterium]|nr:YjgN family protein [Rhodospirillaceae bacterium]
MNRTENNAAPVDKPEDIRPEPFQFTGTGREYFGIWIVNILLTIVTFGIYSAWAKVRRQRYFYGNTRLAGHAFDYHARPKQILIGRIIVLAGLFTYNIVVNLFPLASLALLLLLFLILPWLIMRGLRFNARVTSYRTVRLDFHGRYWGAAKAYIAGPLLAAVTLGILAPLATRWAWRYSLGNLRYGGRPVACDPNLKSLYGQWWLSALIVLIGFVLLGGFSMSIYGFLGWEDSLMTKNEIRIAILSTTYLFMLSIILIYAFAGLFYRAGTRNIALNAAILDERHHFSSALSRRRYAWIAISNLLATLFTLGLARPWAAVRMARYVAAATTIRIDGSLDDYLNQVTETGPAISAEYLDMEGFDFGF